MSIFKEMLGAEESVFRDTVALDFDYIPKMVPYREKEQKAIAVCIKPLFDKRNGKNVLVHGPAGIGKTVAIKHLLRELEEESEDILPIYINCWQRNTEFKIVTELCHQLGYKFTQNKSSADLFKIASGIINKKSAAFVFDEIDKMNDPNFLYQIIENIYRKTVILITNYKEWLTELDPRIRSRLLGELVEFKGYTSQEIKDILQERMKYAFNENVFEQDAFELVIDKTVKINDVRSGLYLLKEAGNIAEEQASKKVKIEHVEKAIEKLDSFSIKDTSELEEETGFILDIIKQNSGEKIGDLFRIYRERSGAMSYKTFQRKVTDLQKGKFVTLEKTSGLRGQSTLVKVSGEKAKKLTDF